MEATCSFETSVNFQLAARRYIPEDKYFERSLKSLLLRLLFTVCMIENIIQKLPVFVFQFESR
jgi:hypothetical protein